MSHKRVSAMEKLAHHFETVYRAAGLEWSSDLTREVESIVDDVIDAAKGQAEEDTKELIEWHETDFHNRSSR